MQRHSDFHAHFRVGPMMHAVTPHQLREVKYALAMPNNGIHGPESVIETVEDAVLYHEQLTKVARRHSCYDQGFSGFIMTVYHTDKTTPAMIEQISKSNVVHAVKYYPPHKGTTTGSGHGIPLSDPRSQKMLAAMQDLGVHLLLHCESPYDKDGNELPHKDREAYFIREELSRVRDDFPSLLMCVEHVSTQVGVEFIKADTSGNTVGTFTPQHAFCTGNDLIRYGTHLKCMPIPKESFNRTAIVEFITSGDWRAIMGTDTAPHPNKKKQLPFAEAPSGCYVPHALGIYTQVFENVGRIEYLEAFASFNGPRWWGLTLPHKDDTVLVHASAGRGLPRPTVVHFDEGDDLVVPLGVNGSDPMYVGFELLE